jgi:hypothetical protein
MTFLYTMRHYESWLKMFDQIKTPSCRWQDFSDPSVHTASFLRMRPKSRTLPLNALMKDGGIQLRNSQVNGAVEPSQTKIGVRLSEQGPGIEARCGRQAL